MQPQRDSLPHDRLPQDGLPNDRPSNESPRADPRLNDPQFNTPAPGNQDALSAAEIKTRIERGVQLSRGSDEDAERGFHLLRSLAESEAVGRDLPGLYFSYFGYGIAAFEARYNDGIALCQRAIEMEFYNTEHHFNLARTYMLLGARRKAVRTIESGLRVDPEDRRLQVLMRELGFRRPPMISFLSRDHPINRWAGALRHAFSSGKRRR